MLSCLLVLKWFPRTTWLDLECPSPQQKTHTFTENKVAIRGKPKKEYINNITTNQQQPTNKKSHEKKNKHNPNFLRSNAWTTSSPMPWRDPRRRCHTWNCSWPSPRPWPKPWRQPAARRKGTCRWSCNGGFVFKQKTKEGNFGLCAAVFCFVVLFLDTLAFGILCLSIYVNDEQTKRTCILILYMYLLLDSEKMKTTIGCMWLVELFVE